LIRIIQWLDTESGSLRQGLVGDGVQQAFPIALSNGGPGGLNEQAENKNDSRKNGKAPHVRALKYP